MHPQHMCVCMVLWHGVVALWQRSSTRECGRLVSCARTGLARARVRSLTRPFGTLAQLEQGLGNEMRTSSLGFCARIGMRCGAAVASPVGEPPSLSSAQLSTVRRLSSCFEPITDA